MENPQSRAGFVAIVNAGSNCNLMMKRMHSERIEMGAEEADLFAPNELLREWGPYFRGTYLRGFACVAF
jgi:hypothetical protein